MYVCMYVCMYICIYICVYLCKDEPEVMEIEVKEALRHISNRKSAGCDGIPIELLKAGGEEAVQVMTGLWNCIWKRKE